LDFVIGFGKLCLVLLWKDNYTITNSWRTSTWFWKIPKRKTHSCILLYSINNKILLLLYATLADRLHWLADRLHNMGTKKEEIERYWHLFTSGLKPYKVVLWLRSNQLLAFYGFHRTALYLRVYMNSFRPGLHVFVRRKPIAVEKKKVWNQTLCGQMFCAQVHENE
jgi:hypothetical protein